MAFRLRVGEFVELFTAAKSFVPDRLIGSAPLNRRGLHVVRVRLAYAINRCRRAWLGRGLDAAQREAFDRDGFVVLPGFLAGDEFRALIDEVEALRTDARERHEGSTLLRKIEVDQRLLLRAPALDRLLKNRVFRALCEYGEGSRTPPKVYLQTVVQQASQSSADPQCTLHRDTFHPTVKAWLYLTDVTRETGPLVYVPRSHKLTPARISWERTKSLAASREPVRRGGAFRISEDELASLGLPAARALAVEANTLVVADTFGFHARGTSTGRSLRMEVWAIGRRAPFLPSWSDTLLRRLLVPPADLRWTQRNAAAAFDDAD